jgi:MFS transporter, NNP family, nitrate/nitrite transporter
MSKRKSYIALTMATLAFAVSFAVWSLLSPLATEFQTKYGIGDFEISLLIAVPVILGALARIPMGVLTDKFGARRVMSILLVFCLIPCIGVAFSNTYWQFLVWAFLLGMAGSSFAVGVPFVSRWFAPEKQGLVIGIFGMGNIGTAISARAMPEISKAWGWQAGFLIFGGLIFVTGLAFYFFAGDEVRPTASKTISQRLTVLKTEKLTWLFSLFYFVTFGCFVALGIYLPKLLIDTYGLDKIDAGNRVLVFVVLATLARPLGGWLSDKFGATKILTAVFGVIPLMAFLLAWTNDIVFLTIAFLTIAGFLGLGNGAVFKLVPQYFGKEAGTVTGLVGAAGGLGGFFPPLVMGLFKTLFGSYALGYLLLASVAVLCLVLNLVILGKGSGGQNTLTKQPPTLAATR